jgi:histidine triad (HIT) family protein
VNGEIPASVEYEDEDILAFDDINPAAPVHILIIPKKHIPDLLTLDEGDEILNQIFSVANKLAAEKGIADSGFRVVANCGPDSGQEVFHLHFHLLGGKKLKGLG